MRPGRIQLSALLAAALLVSTAATRIHSINEGRKSLNLLGSASPVENTPPEYAFAIQALGAFRSLITDIAFIRAEQYKDEGRFYDAMQLAKWICTLQPHFPSVWEFASWNMAWNISVTTYTPEERWNWVYNGVKLLRDQAIQRNLRAVNLYKQLAWTFNNKMGETLDDFHYAYKCNWAWRMHLLLGPPPDPLAEVDPAKLADQLKPESGVDALAEAARVAFEQNEAHRREFAAGRGVPYVPRTFAPPTLRATAGELPAYEAAKRAAAERTRRIAEAPAKLEELYQRYPAAREMVQKLRGLGIVIGDSPLSEDEYWRDGGLAFTFFAPYRMLGEGRTTLARITRASAVENEERSRAGHIDEILGVRADDPAGEALVQFLQRKVLLDVYKLEPALMTQVIETFGPVDWRSLDAQSLYWITKGLQMSGESPNQFGSDKTNTARIIFFSLRGLYLRGRIVFEPYPERIYLSYLSLNRDLNFIEPMHQAYLRYGPLFDTDSGKAARGAGSMFRVAHFNFLSESILLLYIAGREAEAGHYLRYLQDTYNKTETGEFNEALAGTLHDFVMRQFLQFQVNPGLREIKVVIEGLLENAYHELAAGNVNRYFQLAQRAREFHADYMRDKQGARDTYRLGLPDFVQMQVDVFGNVFMLPPSSSVDTLDRVRLWRAAPLTLRQSVYDELLPLFQEECKAWDYDVAQAYPEPKGMEDYRKNPINRFRSERPDAIETLPMQNK